MSELTLRLNNVGRWFGVNILFRGINIELRGGTSCLIAGPNGSGKSTLMRILAGVLRSSEGEVHLIKQGNQVRGEERPLHSMLVGPYLGLYRGLSARENVQFAVTSLERAVARDEISAVLERVGVSHAADRLVAHYSSGMVQRLRLAIALVRKPDVYLLDEPWMNLDTDGRNLVMEEVTRMQEAGRVVVIASNDPSLKRKEYAHQINLLDFAE